MTFGRISFKIEDIKGDWPTKEGRIRAVSGLDCGGVSGGRHCELRVGSQAAREIAAGAAGGRGRFQRSELRAGAGLAKVKPQRMERLPDGRTLRVWVDGGYSIALLFDAGEVCLGVQDERMG